jgi:hypothetical protein
VDSPSSTSSFDETSLRAGKPWGLFGALLIIALVECVFRLLPTSTLIPYELGIVEYQAAASVVQAEGPADVAIVGNSRAREGVFVPDLRRLLQERAQRELRVSNYSIGGAQAYETHAFVKYLLRHGRPQLLLYGVTCRDLLGSREDFSRAAVFWDLSDWWAHYQIDRERSEDVLPEVMRRQWSGGWWTLRYRDLARIAIDRTIDAALKSIRARRIVSPARGAAIPMLGGLTDWQLKQRTRSLITQPVTEQHVKAFVARLLEHGKYPLTNERERELAGLLRDAKQAGVPVVLFEVPLSQVLWRNKPAGLRDEFLSRVRRVAASTDTPFLTVEALKLELQDEHFLEQSHLNHRGARLLTAALSAHLPVPSHGR